jgi:hypothetical protein
MLWLVDNSGEKLCSVKIFVCGNFLQHLEHSFEMTPHYNRAEDRIRCGILLQDVLHIGGARWRAPAFFPGFSGLGQKILLRRPPLYQRLGGCYKANMFRCAGRKQSRKKLQRSSSHAAEIGGRGHGADGAYSCLGLSSSSMTSLSKRLAPPPSALR